MVVDVATSFHFRPEGEGILIGYNWDCETSQNPDAAPVFDFKFLEALAEVGLCRLPLLSKVGFDTKKSWAGYYAETPDHHAIIGEMYGIFIAAGFGGHGIMHSPAAGDAIANIVLGKKPRVDVAPLRPSRFAEGDKVVEDFVI
jgi:sarcosine oxidase subunit beta